MNSAFQVTPITESFDMATLRQIRPSVDLGAMKHADLKTARIEVAMEKILGFQRRQATDVFLLEWDGGRVPSGAEIKGKKIGYTRDGAVTATDGSLIGTYERIIDSGGENHRQQVMLIVA